jgi:phosphonate degradation associated HDIG domain protein
MIGRPWRELDTPRDVAERLTAVFDTFGHGRYDEAVSQSEHAAQAAALAREAGAGDDLVVAALLHDLGHLLGGDAEADGRDRDLHHEDVASRFLARWFGPGVTEPIRHHVEAKRYLCATDPSYLATLSPASVHSLALQGGVMDPEQAAEFVRRPYAAAAIQLRRWDDLAKEPSRIVAPVRAYLDDIAALVACAPTSPPEDTTRRR